VAGLIGHINQSHHVICC